MTERNGYQVIAGRLADEVAELAPGTKLASEHELMDRFGVGRASARAAVQELERRGLVRRVRGSGTFVNRRIDYVISRERRPSWHRTVESAGAVPRSTVLSSQLRPVPERCAHYLGVEPGTEVHHMRRLRFVDDHVAAVGEEWVKRDALTELGPAMRIEESLDELLRQMGRVDVVRSWCRTAMELPSEEIQAALEMNYVAPVWVVESINRDAATGTAVTYSTAWMRADVIRVVMEIGDTEPAPNIALHR
ncbi:GntR family transcriptional regulator [Rhodococcus chondri]|uniref:GntR family transcriptional regulator n=1 Tax=Rhodococcus chondri TaxID=3065941 RepID=A0ABU7JW13_9NOCA|nr:GntR family transcriptional regulator [Rhodococcus sp. CC-R104]MEE2033477.1 GntR family transcriptional regulator [Rhodococcus sp. CC-R104]